MDKNLDFSKICSKIYLIESLINFVIFNKHLQFILKGTIEGGNVMAEINYEAKKDALNTENNEIVWKDRKHFMWFPITFTKYTVRKGRIYIDKGLINSVQDQTLLYRITDIQLRRSLAQKIFGTGTIVLVTKADMSNEILLENIKKPQQVNDMFADLIEDARKQRNVVGKEFFSSDCDHDLDDDLIDNDMIDNMME